MVRYNRELLEECIKRDNSTLVEENLGNITSNTQIYFICICGTKHNKLFSGLYKEGGAFCKKCSSVRALTKRKESNIKKYGVEHSLQNKDVRAKGDITIKEKYGVDNISQLKETKQKVKDTNKKKFGVDYPAQNPEIMEKMTSSNFKVRGVKNPGECPIVKEKMKQTNINKYGVVYTLQSKEVRDKIKDTNLSRYGVEHALQYPNFIEKQIKTSYSYKEVISPSGKVLKMQGYEPFAYKELINRYNEDEIIIKRTEVPEIWWTDNDGKKHRYFVDFYIPKEKLMIEVKSTRTYENDEIKGKIDGIIDSCEEAGYKIEIWGYDKKGKRVVL